VPCGRESSSACAQYEEWRSANGRRFGSTGESVRFGSGSGKARFACSSSAVLAEMPLSIMTKAAVEGVTPPYDDGLGADGFLRYRYRGTDPGHRDNVGLRLAMRRGVPLVYLFGVTPGRYMPVWPVFIVRDHPEELAFSVAVDAPYMPVLSQPQPTFLSLEARRADVTAVTQRRVHQQGFRERVLQAYQTQCANLPLAA
jgi:putative restriction endonuclease